MSITNGSQNEIDHWSAKVLLGANYREGNTEQIEYNGHLNVARYTVRNRITGDYIGNYSITQEVEQANNHRATTGWDRFVTEKFFVTLLFGEYFRDRFQNIRHRGTLGAGVGYQIADTPRVEWQAAMGPAFQRTRFFDVTETTSEAESTPAWIASTELDVEVTGSIDFSYDYRLQWTNELSGTYNHHMVTGLEFELTKRIDLDVSLVWDRIQNPRPTSEGFVPLPNDYRLIFSWGFEL